MHLKIDHREHDRSESATEYYQQQGLTVETVELPVGDYLFTDGKDSVVFEYKTIPDYISSINDGRLWNEAINQAENYNYHFIIIHGDLYQRTKELIKSRDYIPMTIQQYIGSISSLNRYTTVIQCYNSVIEEAYFTMMKQAEKCLSNRPIVKKFPKKHKNSAFNFLCYTIYGINYKKADAIVKKYNLKTLSDLQNLTIEKLVKVDGIGERNAKRIMEAIK
jgi:DNA excision repair protein ERCC-4